MPKAFIAGAKIATGGAYMAYQIGKLLHLHFGYELVDIHVFETGESLFAYDVPMRTVSVAEAEQMVTADDVMVINPIYSSFLFGLRLPGKKIMYIQDFRTFQLLDCHMDCYVSVSQTVSRFVHAVYGINSPVIPPFIDVADAPAPKPWAERPEASALVYIKQPSREHELLLQILKHNLPHIDLTRQLEGRGLKHSEFLKALGEVRYLVNLSLAEGFGLVPLEAMAMGTLVTGVDGLSGSDYMRPKANAMVGSIRNLRHVPAMVQQAFADDGLAQQCVDEGIKTAARYGYEPFKRAWLATLSQTLERTAHGA